MSATAAFSQFADHSVEPAIRGFLHTPAAPSGDSLVLTHGAGGNCQSPLLAALATEFADAGFLVLRCDLPFRQMRPYGPPSPATAARDREGLRQAVAVLKARSARQIFLGGHSYGGRQCTMLAAERPDLVDGLLLLSYPLHPPGRESQLRVEHFPKLRTPAMFVHGSRDPFGTLEEMRSTLAMIPARTELMVVEQAGHDLASKPRTKDFSDLARRIVVASSHFFTGTRELATTDSNRGL
jgi:uncharacterized protein